MNKEEIIQFERDVAAAFDAGKIRSPIHISGGNEDALIAIFDNIAEDDWVFSTHRSHYHALLHGVPRDKVMAEILAGHSMNLNFPEHSFYTSAIVGGNLSIALGVAAGIKRRGGAEIVWCFVGDMAATMGIFHECIKFAEGHALPISFVIEDNGMATNTNTIDAWGKQFPLLDGVFHYHYQRTYPHTGTGSGKRVEFK